MWVVWWVVDVWRGVGNWVDVVVGCGRPAERSVLVPVDATRGLDAVSL